MREREREKKRKRERGRKENLSSAGLLVKWLQQLEMGQPEAKNFKFLPGFHVGKGTQTLRSMFSAFPGVLAGSWKKVEQLGLKPSMGNVGTTNGGLTYYIMVSSSCTHPMPQPVSFSMS